MTTIGSPQLYALKSAVLVVFAATLSGCGGTSSADDSAGVAVGAVATCDQAEPFRTFNFVLEKTVLRSTSDGLEVTWATSELMPTTGTVLYSVFASGAGESSLQLGVKYLDAAQIGYFVYDANEGNQSNLDGAVDARSLSVSALYPWSELDALGESFRWWAGLNVDGADVTSCPRLKDGSQGTRAFP